MRKKQTGEETLTGNDREKRGKMFTDDVKTKEKDRLQLKAASWDGWTRTGMTVADNDKLSMKI